MQCLEAFISIGTAFDGRLIAIPRNQLFAFAHLNQATNPPAGAAYPNPRRTDMDKATPDSVMALATDLWHADGGEPFRIKRNELRAEVERLAAQAAPSEAELLADTPTPKPQEGLWTLTAPDGRTYQADSPLRCCGLEQRERVPADVAMARIFRSASEPDDSELLDWLDATNKRFKMGWKVSVAPAGNCSVQSVICLGNSEPVTIRAAIRAARAKE